MGSFGSFRFRGGTPTRGTEWRSSFPETFPGPRSTLRLSCAGRKFECTIESCGVTWVFFTVDCIRMSRTRGLLLRGNLRPLPLRDRERNSRPEALPTSFRRTKWAPWMIPSGFGRDPRQAGNPRRMEVRASQRVRREDAGTIACSRWEGTDRT